MSQFPKGTLFKDAFPHLFLELHPTLNTHLDVTKLTYGSGKYVWWKCPDHKTCDKHFWKDTVTSRTKPSRAQNCPFCSGNNRCCPCRSFMKDPLLNKEFTLAGDLNKDVNPWEIARCSGKELWWKCSGHTTCDDHVWQATVSNRSSNGTKCPFCSPSSGRVCRCDSFMKDPILVKQFLAAGDLNKHLDIAKLSHGSMTLVWWKCLDAKCDHHLWCVSMNERFHKNRVAGCPFCVNNKGKRRRVCPCDSFMNDKRLSEMFCLELNPHIDPWKIGKGSERSITWKCPSVECAHIWDECVKSTSRTPTCPECMRKKHRSQGLLALRKVLAEFSYTPIEGEERMDERRHKAYLPTRRYDFIGKNRNGKVRCYEFDGAQHFIYMRLWHRNSYEFFLERQDIDRLKNLVSLLCGIPIIRISNPDEDHIRRTVTYFESLEMNVPFIGFDNEKKYAHMLKPIEPTSIIKFCPAYGELLKQSPYTGMELKYLYLPTLVKDIELEEQLETYIEEDVIEDSKLPLPLESKEISHNLTSNNMLLLSSESLKLDLVDGPGQVKKSRLLIVNRGTVVQPSLQVKKSRLLIINKIQFHIE